MNIRDILSILCLIVAAAVAVYTFSEIKIGTSEFFLGLILTFICLIESRLIEIQQSIQGSVKK